MSLQSKNTRIIIIIIIIVVVVVELLYLSTYDVAVYY